MDDCKETGDCKPQPNLTIPETPTPSAPIERVRRLVMAEDPCCPDEEPEGEEELGITVQICGELRIVNGRITQWPASLFPLFEIMSSDDSILVDQRGCSADITLPQTNANFKCTPGIDVQNGRIIALDKLITEIAFDEDTCLEVKGYDSETCRLRIGLRDGCQPLNGSGTSVDTGGGINDDGQLGFGGTVVYTRSIGCTCPSGPPELASVAVTVERIESESGVNVWRVGLGGGSGISSIEQYLPGSTLGSQWSRESDAIDAANGVSCISCAAGGDEGQGE